MPAVENGEKQVLIFLLIKLLFVTDLEYHF